MSDGGKGDKRRPEDRQAFEDGYTRIFGDKKASRGKFIWDKQRHEFVDASEYVRPAEGHFIIGEIEAYQSPVDGRVIDSRAKRRNDLARSGCRPWEGMAAEKKEAARVQAENRAAADARINEGVARAYYQMDPRKREILRGSR